MPGNVLERRHDQEGSLVQRAFFAGPFPEAPGDLYALATEGIVERERERVLIQPHARLSTNTFFGRFPASYWQRWTEVEQVELCAVVHGTGQVSIRASDSAGDARTVATVTVQSAQHREVRLPARIDRYVDGGAMWLEASTGAATLLLESARWSVRAPGRVRSTALVICTHDRADACLSTLDTLSRDTTALTTVGAVYVIDQGNDLVESRTAFAAVRRALGPKLRYLRQPNLGGAGGFTRGMYEVMEAGHAGILFMDDDIALEPDTVIRLTAFSGYTTTPTIVGGQMLYLLHPDQLHVGAETADLTILRAGLPVANALVQSDQTRTHQEIRVDADYNAWWACLIPSEVVAGIGYPLPIFFQWDDIEYGLRARACGYPTVTLPGAGVWHADFHWKDWDDWSRYFSLRNSLIVNALHGPPDRTGTARFLMKELLRYLVSMRYGMAATLIMAVESFLAGPEALLDGGVTAAATVRDLRAGYPETIRHPAHGIPDIPTAAMPITPALPAPSKPRLVLLKRLIWQLLGWSRGTAAISARDAYWWHVSLFTTAVVTDLSQEGVRVRRLDRSLLLKLAIRGGHMLVRLVREDSRLRRRYRAAVPELTSRRNWRRLFDASVS